MEEYPFFLNNFLIYGGFRRDNPHETVQNRQPIDSRAGGSGYILAIFSN